MADNYLENKMEEYRRRGAPVSRRRLSPTFYPAGTVSFDIGIKTVYVSGVDNAPEIGEQVVSVFRKAGCRVAFAWHDIKDGRRLAQITGAQHHPVEADGVVASKERVVAAWGGIDIDICVGKDVVVIDGQCVNKAAECPADVFSSVIGRLCLYLVLPFSKCLIDGDVTVGPDGQLIQNHL